MRSRDLMPSVPCGPLTVGALRGYSGQQRGPECLSVLWARRRACVSHCVQGAGRAVAHTCCLLLLCDSSSVQASNFQSPSTLLGPISIFRENI